MQVYALPKDRREVTELKVPWNGLLGLHKLKERGVESQTASGVWKMSKGVRLKSNTSRRRITMDVEVNIRTGETYMLFKSYICVTESQWLNKRNKYQMQKTYGYRSCREMRWNAYMWGNSHSNINANGKTNWETNQK